ncbi:RNA polymerase sigma-70 factor (ECF subfamily) [Actinoplanes lutulentus]|uniref:RNA polymerase sigma-70 factor (ECF subfamily) n=1 Tax=Actinoplanes lutulentus TaxID=1287878 RepID=A0A327ZK56_9ACTN|nr:RNA polymerase sigma factor [Actinoplanes lutulentus]MBB2940933.1 RNA polymerase sigma-70 factor (ECF subfamily) [Actinoplanes lutulentus]RAK43242.1 RNA polymerase sigma-70 factor (ECF subfamily) [Actinoplanes lutulentus]
MRDTAEGRFRALYADAYADVLHFAQRRVDHAHAEDVVADAFLVAWRRFDEAPGRADDLRAWLFGIARNCVLNVRRGQGRQSALGVRVVLSPAADLASSWDFRVDLAAAWGRLSDGEQEALALTVFEDLSSAQAARVLGISATAYRLRLLRARRALRVLLEPAAVPVLDLKENLS